MAKYTIKNRKDGDRRVNCRVLNESAGDYIVQFDDKSIKKVPADRVDSLNRVDEGVLDKVRELGGKIVSGLRKVGKWIKMRLNGEEAEVVSPANIYSFRDTEGVAVFGDGSMREVAEEMGADSSNFDNFSGEPDNLGYDIVAVLRRVADYMKSHNQVKESHRSPYRKVNKVNEANAMDDEYLSGRGTLELAPYTPNNIQSIDGNNTGRIKPDPTDMQTKSYSTVKMNRGQIFEKIFQLASNYIKYGYKDGSKCCICVWGRGGIGKTDLINAVVERMKEMYPGYAMRPANLSSTETWDIVVYDTDSKNDDPNNIKTRTIDSVYQPWMPVYRHIENFEDLKPNFQKQCESIMNRVKGYSTDDYIHAFNEMCDNVANGGYGKINEETGEHDVIRKGDGGIIFLDEFSRVRPDTMNAIMTILSERKHNGFILGSKWFFVLAANRMVDLDNTNADSMVQSANEKFVLDTAMVDRIENIEYIPSYAEWKVYMKEAYNAPDDILDFLEKRILLWLQDPESDDYMPTENELTADPMRGSGQRIGNPRNWTDVIVTILNHMRDVNRLASISEIVDKVFKDNDLTYEDYLCVANKKYPDYAERRAFLKKREKAYEELEAAGIERSEAAIYADHMIRHPEDKGKTINKWSDIDPETLTNLSLGRVGAAASSTLVHFADAIRKFTPQDAVDAMTCHFPVYDPSTHEVSGYKAYITPDEVATRGINDFTTPRMIEYFIDAFMNGVVSKASRAISLDNCPEMYNIIAYFIVMLHTGESKNNIQWRGSITNTVIAECLRKIINGIIVKGGNKITANLLTKVTPFEIVAHFSGVKISDWKTFYGLDDDGNPVKNMSGARNVIQPQIEDIANGKNS